jgi:hypothetical protein
MTTKQKVTVAVIGGSLIAQGVFVANMARVGINVATTADALFTVVSKHADKLDEADMQMLRNLPLLKGKI